MRERFETMGTVASVALDHRVSIEPVRAIFDELDEMFSLYRPESAMSALARGDLMLTEAPEVVRAEYARAIGWRATTGGWFTPHRPDGVVDLSGTIKALAIQQAVDHLTIRGRAGLLGVGGDIAVIGRLPNAPKIGVTDPADRTRMLVTLTLGARRAIATSGSAERGNHIWSPLGESDIIQATVLADDILTADVLATALVAAGADHIDDLTTAFDIDALVVLKDQTMLATPRLRTSML